MLQLRNRETVRQHHAAEAGKAARAGGGEHDVRVGAGSVVLKNLPANATAVGVPAEIVRVGNIKCCPADDLDQQDLPDIVNQRISELEARLSRLEAEKQGEFPPDKKE